MRFARISNPTRSRFSRPSTISSSKKKKFTERNFLMASKLRHRSVLQRTSATVIQSMVHGVPFTIRRLESSWTMVRDLLVISGTMLRTPLVTIQSLTVLADSKVLVLATTLTSTPSVTSLWLDLCNKFMAMEAWSSIMLNASMLSKFHISTSRRVSKKRKTASKLIELSKSLESQQLLCHKRTQSFLLKLSRLTVTRSLQSRSLWSSKSLKLRLNRPALQAHQMSRTFNWTPDAWLTRDIIPIWSMCPQTRQICSFPLLMLWTLDGKLMFASIKNITKITVLTATSQSSLSRLIAQALLRPSSARVPLSRHPLMRLKSTWTNMLMPNRSPMLTFQIITTGERLAVITIWMSTEIRVIADLATLCHSPRFLRTEWKSNMVKKFPSSLPNTSWPATIWTRVVTVVGHSSMVSCKRTATW